MIIESLELKITVIIKNYISILIRDQCVYGDNAQGKPISWNLSMYAQRQNHTGEARTGDYRIREEESY